MEVSGKKMLVVGLGKSGAAAALFLKVRGARVTVSDSKPEEQLGKDIPRLLEHGIAVETGGHGERTFRDPDMIVVSPGVPPDVPQLAMARERKVPVIGEVELAFRFLRGKTIAITGSNGKTTTTTMVGEVLQKSGMRAQVGGNIGTPVISLVETSTADTWNVIEVSSFQLESTETFHPRIAVLLNITPDHLDRHGTFDAYVAAKQKMFANQTSEDHAVLNADDAASMASASATKAEVWQFSRRAVVARGAYIADNRIMLRDSQGTAELMPVSEILLKGAHNLENSMAAACAAHLAGCPADSIRRALHEFKAVEHRLQHVATIEGVEYYNDSKATNVDATMKALEAFPKGIHLILGGKDKGSDYTVLVPLLKQRAKRVYTIGAAAEKIESQLAGAVPIVRVGTVEAAVRSAALGAAAGDVVLLAPACASFDQFENYEHRGRAFTESVKELLGRKAQPAGMAREDRG